MQRHRQQINPNMIRLQVFHHKMAFHPWANQEKPLLEKFRVQGQGLWLADLEFDFLVGLVDGVHLDGVLVEQELVAHLQELRVGSVDPDVCAFLAAQIVQLVRSRDRKVVLAHGLGEQLVLYFNWITELVLFILLLGLPSEDVIHRALDRELKSSGFVASWRLF